MQRKSSAVAVLAALVAVLSMAAPASAQCPEGNTDPNYCQGPLVTTGEATSVGPRTATLTGTVNPRGSATTYRFELGTTTGYGTNIPASNESAGSANQAQTVQQTATGLTPGTEYHYRLVATDAQGRTSPGRDRTFRTTAAAAGPTAVTGDATNVSGAAATIAGSVNPNGRVTSYAFAYGLTTSYGQRTPIRTLPAGTAGVPVNEALSGLAAGTTYHYQLVAVNDEGTIAMGGDRTFTTTSGSKVRPRRVTSSVRPRRDRTRPYRYRVRGRIVLPASLTSFGALRAGLAGAQAQAAQTRPCSGRVRITIKQGRRTRGRYTARVRSNCRYAKRVTAKRVRGRRGKLRITARFRGNAVLAARTASRKTVRFG